MRAAISAASIGNVPEPHIGSISGTPSATRRGHSASNTTTQRLPAASVAVVPDTNTC